MATIIFTKLSAAAKLGPGRDTRENVAYPVLRFLNPGDVTTFLRVVPAGANGCVYLDDAGDEVSYKFNGIETSFTLHL